MVHSIHLVDYVTVLGLIAAWSLGGTLALGYTALGFAILSVANVIWNSLS